MATLVVLRVQFVPGNPLRSELLKRPAKVTHQAATFPVRVVRSSKAPAVASTWSSWVPKGKRVNSLKNSLFQRSLTTRTSPLSAIEANTSARRVLSPVERTPRNGYPRNTPLAKCRIAIFPADPGSCSMRTRTRLVSMRATFVNVLSSLPGDSRTRTMSRM